MTEQEQRDAGQGDEELADVAGRKERRKLRARRQGHRAVWFWLGMMGLVGWSVAVPTLLGLAAGWWLDQRFGGTRSWTLTGLVVGVAVGALTAWYWIKRESQRE